MGTRVTRRAFVKAGAVVGAASAAPRAVAGQGPAVLSSRRVKPVLVSSANGHRFKNGGAVTCVEKAFALITRGDDVLDALLAGVNIVELDPEDTSVGYGGLPNGDGVVQLDASCMHGPTKRAGGVACLEGVRTPSLVAKSVLEVTDHHLLVGQDAQKFARQMGFTIEADLNTPRSRNLWLEWRRRTDPVRFPDPKARADAGRRALQDMIREGLLDRAHVYGTINCSGVGPNGDIASVTTTSGMAWKIPGRVGDSPILGAGLYVDNDVGAAGSTGRGEANLYGLCCFLVVEKMRQGLSPRDAGIEALKRIRANTVQRHLLNARGLPAFNVDFYVVNARGEHAGVSLYASRYAVCTEHGPEILETVAMLEGSPEDGRE